MKLAYSYAKALIELDDSKIFDDYKAFLSLINENNDFKKLLNMPIISNNEKKEIIKVLDKKFSSNFINFLYVLIDNSRINLLEKIFYELEILYYEKNNILLFIIKTASTLNDSILDNIKSKLELKYKKEIILRNIVEKNLLGGYLITCNNKIMDNSILNNLECIKNNIK